MQNPAEAAPEEIFRLNGVDRAGRSLELPDSNAYYFTVTATEVVACKEPLVPVTVMA
jgi:hypothetical protein